jgi:hypothetical protein
VSGRADCGGEFGVTEWVVGQLLSSRSISGIRGQMTGSRSTFQQAQELSWGRRSQRATPELPEAVVGIGQA